MPDTSAPTTGGVKATLSAIPGDYINVRAQPNGADVGDLLRGDVVTYYPDAPADGWVYQTPVKSMPRPAGRQNATAGWVSLQNGAVQFTNVVEPPPADETYILTKDQYQRLAGVKVQIGARLQALDQVRVELVSAQTEIAKILQEVVPADDGSSFPA